MTLGTASAGASGIADSSAAAGAEGGQFDTVAAKANAARARASAEGMTPRASATQVHGPPTLQGQVQVGGHWDDTRVAKSRAAVVSMGISFRFWVGVLVYVLAFLPAWVPVSGQGGELVAVAGEALVVGAAGARPDADGDRRCVR